MASSSHGASQALERRLHWEGCFNVRDLGGHRSSTGALTRRRAVVRSDTRERLTAAGWGALGRYGIGSIVDLRDPAEHAPHGVPAAELELTGVPLFDFQDDAFWGDGRWRGLDHSAAFYVAVVERWPQRLAAAVRQVAHARPGGVLIHCHAGRDRTGLVAAALLTLIGVDHAAIAADYAESQPCLQPLYDRWLECAGDEAERERIRRANVSPREVMLELLHTVDLPSQLLAHGLTEADVASLRERLLEPAA